MEKSQGFIYLLSLDEENKRCQDKIFIISLVHGTGHITMITKKGKEIKTRLADLIKELQTDQLESVIKSHGTIFENFVLFKYPEKRSDEFDKIVAKAKLKVLETVQTDLGCFEVKVQIDNVNLDLIPFIRQS